MKSFLIIIFIFCLNIISYELKLKDGRELLVTELEGAHTVYLKDKGKIVFEYELPSFRLGSKLLSLKIFHKKTALYALLDYHKGYYGSSEQVSCREIFLFEVKEAALIKIDGSLYGCQSMAEEKPYIVKNTPKSYTFDPENLKLYFK